MSRLGRSPGTVTLTLDVAPGDYVQQFYSFSEATVRWTEENTVQIIGIIGNGPARGTLGTYTYPRERVIAVSES